MPARHLDLEDLSGCLTALPTPFTDGAVDEAGFAALCQWQIGLGVAGLVVCSVTGEASTLRPEEQGRLVRRAVATAGRRVPVLAGIVANATASAVALARQAEQAGADGLLAAVPSYNRPSQEGLVGHFRAIHDAVGLPLFLSDAPRRACRGLEVETILRLAELPRVGGLEDATGDLARPPRLRRRLGPGFRLLSGDDATALGFLAQGGDGSISVAANVAPKLMRQMHDAFRRGDRAEAGLIAALLDRLTAALALESDPVPVKHALARMGRLGEALRLPLCPAGEATRAALAQAMAPLGLIAPPSRVQPRAACTPAMA